MQIIHVLISTQSEIYMQYQAFKSGRQAYLDGKSIKDNPNEQYSEEFNQWQKGFKTAKKEDVEHDPDGN